jgi:thiosulfate/3-mercaptopyruvate sulfurtransferase
LSGPASAAEGRHPLPTPEVFAEAMASAGIGDDTTVVAYDDQGGVIAARLVFLLRATGHQAALLDGGLAAYDGVLSTERVSLPRKEFVPVAWPRERFVDLDEALAAPILIDARPATRFAGEPDALDPRAGHIPGARSLPCRENLDASGQFLPIDELRAKVEALGITRADELVSSCGSGVTACHNLLMLEQAGYGVGRLYVGSWSQYSNTDRPVATGKG